MSTPLSERTRRLLIPKYAADVRAWKADDPAETTVLGVKNTAVDADDCSFYAITKAGMLSADPAAALTYLGTTQFGKDGWPAVLVYNSGEVVILSSETPIAGQSGSEAAIWVVVLNYNVGAEPSGSSVADLTARTWCHQIVAALKAGTAQLPPI